MKLTSNGIVIYRGPSLLDNITPIVVIATGLKRPTSNIKTGNMIQTWILREDVAPHTAAHNGQDVAICGDCPLTKLLAKNGDKIRNRRCYVETQNAPQQIWRAFQNDRYDDWRPEFQSLFKNRKLRLGAYGDPVACPLSVWAPLCRVSDGWTGYSHSWRVGRFWRFRRYVMASCETAADHDKASAKGWRTFSTQSEFGSDQIMCPNYSHEVQCADCNLCSGASTQAKSIVIPPHGGNAIMSAWKRSLAV